MQQTTRTFAFAVAAVAALGIAFATHRAYQPADPLKELPVGQPFYADFSDPNAATGLRVATYDTATAKTNAFSVENKAGVWRIPSHHDYPADGESRLAKIAASMIGVTRKAFVEASEAAHKRYKLLDPLDSAVAGTEGRGDRITLMKGDDVLVDFIVGNKLEGEEGIYYVRRADDKAVYTADLGNLEISTKFADWIKPDLLDVAQGDIRELIINSYHVDEAKGSVVPEEQNRLHRDTATAPWNLEDLDTAKEQVKTSEINSTLSALADLAIVGVRKKPAGLSAGLKSAEGLALTTADRMDLQEKGYYFDPRQGALLSNEGEVLVGAENGVLYVLRFGEEFSGTDVEIEVGGAKKEESADQAASTEKAPDPAADTTAAAATEETPKPDEAAKDGEEKDEENKEDALAKSRFVFITVQFDPDLLGAKPEPPVKPEPPAEQPAATPAEQPAADAVATPPADGAAPPTDEQAKPDPQAEYKKALEDYELKEEIYKTKLKEYEDNLKAGQKKVDDLNARFADWYYVISSDVFDRLRLKRAAIVEPAPPKVEQATDPAGAASAAPAAPADGTTPPPPAEGAPQSAPPSPETPQPVGDTPSGELPQVKPGEPMPVEPSSTPEPVPADANPESPATPPATESQATDPAPASPPVETPPSGEAPAAEAPPAEAPPNS